MEHREDYIGMQDMKMDEFIELCEECLRHDNEVYCHILYEMAVVVEAFKGCSTLYETDAYFTFTVLEKGDERAYMTLPLPLIEGIVDTYKEIVKPGKHLGGFTLTCNSKVPHEELVRTFDESMRFWQDLESKFMIKN